MAKSPPPMTKPAAAPERVSGGKPANTLPPLKVTYYRRMSLQRVYGVTVAWHNRDKRRPPAGTGPVLVRLLMAGAQVVPSEQPLDPAKPDAKAAFYVTPLARGWLRHECLEVLLNGRKVQELPLPAKVTSQKMTWLFLVLAFLVPWFLLSWCKYSVLKSPEKGRGGTPGQILQAHITDNLPPVPDLPEAVKNTGVEDALTAPPEYAGKFYELLWINSGTEGHHLPYYTALTFLVLAFVSWLAHNDRRRRKVGKPIPLPSADAPVTATVAEDFV